MNFLRFVIDGLKSATSGGKAFHIWMGFLRIAPDGVYSTAAQRKGGYMKTIFINVLLASFLFSSLGFTEEIDGKKKDKKDKKPKTAKNCTDGVDKTLKQVPHL